MSEDPFEALWIFGYGSLVWRPDFPFAQKRSARLRHWARRFWQGSTDHRGVPGAPGRVVTLVREAESECVGVAYRVAPADAEHVLEALDHREKGGYERHRVELEWLLPASYADGAAAADATPTSPTRALVYVATAANENHLGPAPIDEIARQVARSRGPSGANPEYVLRLADALRELGASDAHVFEIERALRAQLESSR